MPEAGEGSMLSGEDDGVIMPDSDIGCREDSCTTGG